MIDNQVLEIINLCQANALTPQGKIGKELLPEVRELLGAATPIQEQYWKNRCEAAEAFIMSTTIMEKVDIEGKDDQRQLLDRWNVIFHTPEPPATAQGVEEEEDYPVTPVVFFVRKDGKYVAENGKEVTIDFILEREHDMYDDSGYVVLAGSRWQQGQQPPTIGARWVRALQEIVDPIKFMREMLQEGERLDGMYAVQLANDANYLKSIAKKALEDESPCTFPTRQEAEQWSIKRYGYDYPEYRHYAALAMYDWLAEQINQQQKQK